MNKIILGFFTLILFSCSQDESPVNENKSIKIQSLTIKDEVIDNDGSITLYEKLDFKFEYNNGKLIKVWDLNNNYTEILSYSNNLLSEINISGFIYPQLADHVAFSQKRILAYSNQLLSKSEMPANSAGDIYYTTFSYPNSEVIYATSFKKNINGTTNTISEERIFFQNGNVNKIEIANGPNLQPHHIVTYEYDQKRNPNSLIDKNRILAMPNYSYNIFMLQNYSQLSKNNVIQIKNYLSSIDQQNLIQTENIQYDYSSNNLPSVIKYTKNSLIVSGLFQF